MSLPSHAKRLEQLVAEGSLEDCLAFLDGLSAAERSALARPAVASLKQLVDQQLGRGAAAPGAPATSWQTSHERRERARAAVLATAGLGELKKLGWRALPEPATAVLTLRRFTPPWVAAWCEALLEDSPMHFRTVHQLVVAGLVARPTSDAWVLGMIQAVAGAQGGRHASLREALLADSTLLEVEVWRLFECEGSGEFSLAATDKYTPEDRGWAATLAGFAAEGRLDRGRLLDASLGALARDFAPFRAGWFSRFHVLLAPTMEEREARAELYLTLLGSAVGPTVSLALQLLAPLAAAGRLDADRLVDHGAAPVAAPAKGTALAALGLLAAAAEREPRVAPRVALLAARALAQGTREVAARALDLLERWGAPADADLRAAVAASAETVAPTLRSRLAAWSGDAPTPSAAARPAPAPAPAPRGPDQAPRPVRDLDDLVDRFAFVLEHPDEPAELERVFEGLSRLAADRPPDLPARLGPLAKRARTYLGKREVGVVREHLCRLALAWATLDCPPARARGVEAGLEAFFRALVEELAATVLARRARPRLSEPTHQRGLVAPAALVERLTARAADGLGHLDLVLALLRLASAGRADAARAAAAVPGEVGAALRYALGAPATVGPTAALWAAAAVVRAPGRDDPALAERHPGLGPDAGVAATFAPAVTRTEHGGFVHFWLRVAVSPPAPAAVPHDLPPVLFNTRLGGWHELIPGTATGHDPATVRWASTVQPSYLEPFFAEGCSRLDVDWNEARWEVRSFLEPLLEPDVPLGPMARLLLALALAAKEPGQRGLAVDALLAAIDDRRLDVPTLGGAMAFLLPTGLVKATRWRNALGEAARHSPAAAAAVALVVQHALGGRPQDAPRDVGSLLELLLELLVSTDASLTVPSAAAWLRGLDGAGKTARLASQLLAREGR